MFEQAFYQLAKLPRMKVPGLCSTHGDGGKRMRVPLMAGKLALWLAEWPWVDVLSVGAYAVSVTKLQGMIGMGPVVVWAGVAEMVAR